MDGSSNNNSLNRNNYMGDVMSMEYEHEKACTAYAQTQERDRILRIIREWNCYFLDRDLLIKAIEVDNV